MGRPAASEDARITRLRAALDRAISQGLVTEALNFGAMAKLLGISRTTLREWCSEQDIASSGALIGGDRGIDYEFNPIAMIWVLIRFWERKRDERTRANLRIREAVAGDSLDSVPSELTIKQASEALDLHLKLLDIERAAEKLVAADEVRAAVNKLVLGLREATLSAPQKLDPTNEWPPEFREQFDNVLADLMVLLRQAGQEALSPDNGPVPAGSTGKGEGAPKRQAVRQRRSGGAKRAGSAATA